MFRLRDAICVCAIQAFLDLVNRPLQMVSLVRLLDDDFSLLTAFQCKLITVAACEDERHACTGQLGRKVKRGSPTDVYVEHGELELVLLQQQFRLAQRRC